MTTDYSQNGEESYILHAFNSLGIAKGHAVDLGAGDGVSLSNTRALIERGWTADLYDGDPRGAEDVQKVWIDTDTVLPLLPDRFNFLNLDLDGNDYWILKTILEGGRRPDMIVCEINPIHRIGERTVMPYNPSHQWDGTVYYGMSLSAAEYLCKLHGYYLWHLHAGINAFFVLKGHYIKLPPTEWKFRVKWDHAPDKQHREWQSV